MSQQPPNDRLRLYFYQGRFNRTPLIPPDKRRQEREGAPQAADRLRGGGEGGLEALSEHLDRLCAEIRRFGSCMQIFFFLAEIGAEVKQERNKTKKSSGRG